MYTGVQRNRVVMELSKTRIENYCCHDVIVRIVRNKEKCYNPVFDSFEMIKLQKSQIFQGILQFSYFVTHVASKLFFGKSYD